MFDRILHLYLCVFLPFNQATMAEYEETVRKAQEAWKVWADVSINEIINKFCNVT